MTYLAWRDLPVPRTSPTSRQLECLRELRDAALAVREETPERFQGRLDRILPQYAFRYGPDGGLVPATEGWDGFTARALPGLFELIASRSRVRACSNPDCRWLFLDRSKNRSRVWCEMATCGSRAKMSRYRRRRTAQSTRPDPGLAMLHDPAKVRFDRNAE